MSVYSLVVFPEPEFSGLLDKPQSPSLQRTFLARPRERATDENARRKTGHFISSSVTES